MGAKSKFANAAVEAALDTDTNVADPSAEWHPSDEDFDAKPKRKRARYASEAQSDAEAAFAAEAERIRRKYDVAVIWSRPRIGKKRTAAEYKFWKQPVMGFIEFPENLDLGPTALAKKYGSTEPNFRVTNDTFRAPLSAPARKEAARLLQSRGYKLKLPADFSIRDIQRAMKGCRDRAAGSEGFKPKIEIVGDIVYCNGKSFKMQPTATGKMRIRVANGWLPIHTLTAFLSAKG